MYWIKNRILIDGAMYYTYYYFKYCKETKDIETRVKIALSEEEFLRFYENEKKT